MAEIVAVHPVVAFNLASTADSVTKTAVALLTLISVAFVIVGLLRAWVGRRRPQVVIENIESVEGMESSAASGLSPQLRQAVRQALLRRA
jgi:hypothetical protein